MIVNPLAVFRLREARRMDRTKTDLTDAEQWSWRAPAW